MGVALILLAFGGWWSGWWFGGSDGGSIDCFLGFSVFAGGFLILFGLKAI